MSRFMNANDKIFPDPWVYKPARWLGDDAKTLRKYMVTFGRGSRSCLGHHMAWAELYLLISAIVQTFDMKLFETTVEDVEFKHDVLAISPKFDSRGVRAFVQRRAAQTS